MIQSWLSGRNPAVVVLEQAVEGQGAEIAIALPAAQLVGLGAPGAGGLDHARMQWRPGP